MTYSYTPGSGQAKDKVRLLIPDRTDPAKNPPAMFSDEELNDLLVESGGVATEAAATACEIIAMDSARQAISFSINGMNINKSSIPSFFLQRAKSLREQLDTTGDEFIDVMEYNVDQWGGDGTEYN